MARFNFSKSHLNVSLDEVFILLVILLFLAFAMTTARFAAGTRDWRPSGWASKRWTGYFRDNRSTISLRCIVMYRRRTVKMWIGKTVGDLTRMLDDHQDLCEVWEDTAYTVHTITAHWGAGNTCRAPHFRRSLTRCIIQTCTSCQQQPEATGTNISDMGLPIVRPIKNQTNLCWRWLKVVLQKVAGR